jgi:hypothetical protein
MLCIYPFLTTSLTGGSPALYQLIYLFLLSAHKINVMEFMIRFHHIDKVSIFLLSYA